MQSTLSTSSPGAPGLLTTIREITPSYVESLRHLAERPHGETLALANGAFDAIHAGHGRLLAWAKSQAKTLVVAINNDESVRQLKGYPRPIHKLEDRAELLCRLRSVDYVVSFGTEQHLREIIAFLRPDVLVKGGDWAGRPVTGEELLGAWGGKLAIYPRTDDLSSTNILKKVSS